MPGEDLHEVGADGARRAKEWLEATTRVKASWTNTDAKWSRRMTFKWPTGKQTQFSLDLGGLLCGGDFDNDIFMAECKKYSTPGDQGTHYLSYLAKCYVIASNPQCMVDHFMWITWCPFNVNDWNKLLSKEWIEKALHKHSIDVFGDIAPEEVQSHIDDELVGWVADRLWMIVLSEKQEQLVITREHRALIQKNEVLEGVPVTVADFSSALQAAFDVLDPREAVSRIKNVVAHELSQTDTRATVKKTDFFNHSFAPDLVLSWPNERERFVFLKSDTRPSVLRHDVDAVRKHDPIVFALDPVHDNPLGADNGVSSRDDDTLLADSRGMEVLIESRSTEPVVGLASSAVLQGGRGLLTEREAEVMASSVAAGFTGAQRLDSGSTAAAVAHISGHFDRRRTARLLRFLGAVWVGSGGVASNFPGEQDMAGDLDATALEFLMELPPIEDYEFWRRIGRPLTLESISRLHLEGESENLQYLVSSNLDILHARACRIIDRQQELGEEEESGFRWKLEREMLSLRGHRSITYFAGRVDELCVEAQEGDGISLEELLHRAEMRRVPISELELATPTRTVSYATVNRDDVSHDEELLKLSKTFSSTARVRTAVASLFGSRPLVCDFPTRTGKGRTAAKFPLGTFAPVALSLLTSLSDEEKSALDQLTQHYVTDEQRQISLFNVDEVGNAHQSANVVTTSHEASTADDRHA